MFTTSVPSVYRLESVKNGSLAIIQISHSVIVHVSRFRVTNVGVERAAQIQFVFNAMFFRFLFIHSRAIYLVSMRDVREQASHLGVVATSVLIVAATISPFILIVDRIREDIRYGLSRYFARASRDFCA